MTTRFLVFAYITFVLVLSSFANASGQTTYIHKANVNQQTGVFTAHGNLATPCQTRPTVVVKKIDETAARLIMDVQSTPTAEICVEVLGPAFDVALDLKDLPLTNGKVYSIFVENAQAPIGILTYKASSLNETERAFRVNKQNFKGVLVNIASPGQNQPDGFALNDGTQSVPVVSPQINLERFRGNQVWLSGYVIQVASSYVDSESFDPGLPNAPQPHAPAVIVPVSISDLKK
jgi:hypothetical protein